MCGSNGSRVQGEQYNGGVIANGVDGNRCALRAITRSKEKVFTYKLINLGDVKIGLLFQ